jgi:tetratricopeptide (TPR) repeat protein
MTDLRRRRLEERRDQALQDLAGLRSQVAAGEIDEERAARLRARYEAEAADAMAGLDRPADDPAAGRSRRRTLIGSGLFVVAATLLTIALVNAVEPRPEGGFVTGGVAAEVVAEGTADLSAISNQQLEEVVAANPEVLPMRLALARRYVEGGDFSAALSHYLFVLERETNPEALMYLGWMTYLSGEAETGVTLLEESLAIQPDDLVAQWFLANALYYGTGDTAAAVPLLESVIASGAAPAEIVDQARAMLGDA